VHSEEPHIPKVNASGGAKLLGEDSVYSDAWSICNVIKRKQPNQAFRATSLVITFNSTLKTNERIMKFEIPSTTDLPEHHFAFISVDRRDE
jgi:hypothetical protein